MSYAVVDVETTGLRPSWHDRIVEVGVVLVSSTGEVEDTWCTLVNPERDLGPQEIHGINSADVLAAPTFADISGTLTHLLRGRMFVAHNARFDAGFLTASYGGLGHRMPIDHSTALCTMHWSSRLMPEAPRALAGCCAYAGITIDRHHSAMSDAAAAAALLQRLLELAGLPRRGSSGALSGGPEVEAWTPPWIEALRHAAAAPWPELLDRGCACVMRGNAIARQVPYLSRLVDSLPAEPGSLAQTDYLALLDRALIDRLLSVRELEALVATAHDLGIDQPAALDLHRTYLRALATAAWGDGMVTDDERDDLHAVATLLDLAQSEVDLALEETSVHRDMTTSAEVPPPVAVDHFALSVGDLVVFTGQMTRSREYWEDRAVAAGLVPHAAVTKKVRLVVAADPDSLSGKARKAAGYGIPIVAEEAFARMLVR
ncbi:MAG: hypothetical protein JJE50_13295 [Actinomycetales bacterium]|nr:hypothetical protein [Actinomycetales bacterium]